ncbi:PAS-domain containing protein [Nitratireductor sp. XY-223]|uniref:PAS-domain containing protein n=1 Tax=Nitratireductor sp. XY-223 TaxID=2561926 RepID=UPI0010AA009F|nr:PAS-domain containing protein [Nitratireductor sp. XY-223]
MDPRSDLHSRYAWEGFQHINQGITIFDEHLRLVFWNDRFLELLEFPRELAFVGADFESFMRYNAEIGEYGSGDVEELVAERVAAAKRFEKHHLERERPDGTIIEVYGSPLPHGGFVSIYTDITIQKKRERELERQAAERTRELRRSQARLQLIADEVPAGIARVDSDMNILFANRKFARAYGLTADEIVGMNCNDVLHPETMAIAKKFFEPAQRGKVVDFEMKVRMRNNRVRDVRTFLRPERAQEDESASFYIVSVDVTRTKAATSALLRSQKMDALGRLSSGISHDFNNLLAIILGNLVPMEERLEDDKLRDEFLVPAISAARRGSGLTERLLNIARKKPINPRPVVADETVSGLVELLRSSIPENIEIDLRLDADGARVLVDVSELETALLNIVVNARDAIDGSGRITLSSGIYELMDDEAAVLRISAGRYLRIAIVDTGSGMTQEESDQIFEPFHTSKGEVGGSGLGLALVYGFVRQSNGTIWVESEPGNGSTFTILLPTTEEHPAAPAQVAGEIEMPDAGKKPLILLVEDDAEVRRVVRRQLTGLGYSTVEAENADAAVELLDVIEELDAILTDVIMPGSVDGAELARLARQSHPAIPIVLMSGNMDKTDHLAHAPDSVSMLRKPFSDAELIAALTGSDSVGMKSVKAAR